MKLRIRGNTVRIRVSQSELTELTEVGHAGDSVEFGPGSRLSYRVEAVSGGAISASYEGDCVCIRLPRAAIERWQRPEEVAMEGEQSLADGRSLKILVEKDFACLVPRSGEEDEVDLFPNPGQTRS
jgi:hypothetical protein